MTHLPTTDSTITPSNSRSEEYQGVKVGFEIELGNAMLSQLTIVMLMVEWIRERYPQEFKAAIKAIQELES